MNARLIRPDNGAARSCYSKHRYDDEKTAKRIAGKCYEQRGARLRAYPCLECGGWHLSSQLKVSR